MSEERFDRIEKTLESFSQDVDRRFGEVAEDVDRRFDALGREMRVLHEDIIDRIQSIATRRTQSVATLRLRSASP